jgi:cytochrome c biogenesis protein
MRQVQKRNEMKKKKERTGLLSSLTLTITLLILLAALSIIGTVIPQNASEQEYLRLYSKETLYLFKGLGLLNMYHSWWFVGVLILLVINLITCSLKRLPGVWQQVRKTRSGYARLGTYLTHLSVLLILVGGLIGAVWGFKGYMEITEGESAEGILIRGARQQIRPFGFAVRCDSFRVDLYPDGSPKEYVSTLTFVQGERVALDQRPLRVNHPISYGGLTFYQSSYGISARSLVEVRERGARGVPHAIQLSQGEVQPIAGTQAQLGLMQYEEEVHGMGEAILLVLFTPDSPPQGFWLFKTPPEGKGQQVEGFTFVLRSLEKKYYTGLQVTRNPGLPVVWVGCTLLVVGMTVTFSRRRAPKKKPSQEP